MLLKSNSKFLLLTNVALVAARARNQKNPNRNEKNHHEHSLYDLKSKKSKAKKDKSLNDIDNNKTVDVAFDDDDNVAVYPDITTNSSLLGAEVYSTDNVIMYQDSRRCRPMSIVIERQSHILKLLATTHTFFVFHLQQYRMMNATPVIVCSQIRVTISYLTITTNV